MCRLLKFGYFIAKIFAKYYTNRSFKQNVIHARLKKNPSFIGFIPYHFLFAPFPRQFRNYALAVVPENFHFFLFFFLSQVYIPLCCETDTCKGKLSKLSRLFRTEHHNFNAILLRLVPV